jgi:hypothetical protein
MQRLLVIPPVLSESAKPWAGGRGEEREREREREEKWGKKM